MKKIGKIIHGSKKNNLFKFMIFFVTISVFFVSTAYALANQLFTISGSATIVNYGDCPAGVDFAYEISNSWGDARSGYTYHTKLIVKNNSNERISGWTITFKGPSDMSFGYVGAEVTVDNGEATLTPTGNYSWAANIEVGETRNIDFQISTAEPTLELEYLYFDSCMVIANGSSSPLRDFTLDPAQMNLKIGQMETINILKMPVNARADFEFSSDDRDIAVVDTKGTVVGVSPGSTTIRVSSGMITRTVQVTVTDDRIELTSLSLDPKDNKMKVGDEKTLTTTRVPADAGAVVEYASSNPEIATVDSNGKVVAVGPGSAVITASSGSLSDSVNVTVIRDAISEDLDATFSYQYYDTNNIQLAINLTNIGHSEIHKISFKISFPAGTTWTYWNNYPAMFQADNTGTVLTSTNENMVLPRGSYINFSGNVTLPRGYNSVDYLSPTIYDIEVE